jgi:hypothetical protein
VLTLWKENVCTVDRRAGAFVFIVCSEPAARGETKLTAQLSLSLPTNFTDRLYPALTAAALGGNLSKPEEDVSRLTWTFT